MSASADRATPTRMRGHVRTTAVPLLRATPDPGRYVQHVTEDGRRVFIAHRVLEDLAELERAEHPDETGGLLFGGFFTHESQMCAVVNELVTPEDGEVIGTPATVTITAAGSERMIARAWRRDPLLRPVGWGHTHPRFEAFFSATDRDEQQRWREPASVGLVLSGLASPTVRHRVFVGPDAMPAEPVAVLRDLTPDGLPQDAAEAAAATTTPPPRAAYRRPPRGPAVAVAVAVATALGALGVTLDARDHASDAHASAARAAADAHRATAAALRARQGAAHAAADARTVARLLAPDRRRARAGDSDATRASSTAPGSTAAPGATTVPADGEIP
jgi:proteasome lid subunit RPN8/RPN11